MRLWQFTFTMFKITPYIVDVARLSQIGYFYTGQCSFCSFLWYRCPKVRSILWPLHYKLMWKSLKAPVLGENHSKCFMAISAIAPSLLSCKVEKTSISPNIDLWPVITTSNVDLESQNLPPIASTRREQSIGLFCEALKRQGVASTPPLPSARTCYGKCPARASVNKP